MARRGGYVGSIDINCIVNEIGIYPLEFTPRFGYPTIALQEESLESPTRQFFHDLAHGLDPSPEVHNGYQVAVRVVLPPFPFDDEKTYDENSRNAAIVFDTPDGTTPEGVHIGDGKRVDGQWRAAGESGMPLVVTAKRETMAEPASRPTTASTASSCRTATTATTSASGGVTGTATGSRRGAISGRRSLRSRTTTARTRRSRTTTA
jgi:hypothetical protein